MSALEWLLLKPKACPCPAAAAPPRADGRGPAAVRRSGAARTTIGAVCEACQVVRGVSMETHTCAVQMANALLPFGGCRGPGVEEEECMVLLFVSNPGYPFTSGAGLLEERQSPCLALGP